MSRRLQPIDGSLRIEDHARLAPLDDSSPPSPLSLDPPRLASPGTSSLVHRPPFASSSMPALSSPSTSKPSFFKRIIRTFVPSKKSKSSTQTRDTVPRNIPPKSPLSQTPILSAPPKPPQPRPKHVSLSAPNAAPIPIDQLHLAPSRAQREANAVRVNRWLEATSPTVEAFDDPNLPSVPTFDRDELGATHHVAVASEGDEPDPTSLAIDHKAFGSIGEDDAPLPPAIVFGSPLSSDTPSNETHPSPTPQFVLAQEIDLLPVVSADGEELPPIPASPTVPAPVMAANRASAFSSLIGGSKASSSSRVSALSPPSSFAAQQDRKSAIPLSKSAPYGKHQSLAASAAPKRASLFNLAHIGGGRSPSMPPPPKAGRASQPSLDGNGSKRQSVMPTMHTTASISAQMGGITDEESKRLTEAAFMF